MQPLPKPELAQLKKLILRSVLFVLRVIVLMALLLFFFQDKLILHPGSSSASEPFVTGKPFGAATMWFEQKHYLGLIYEPKTREKGTMLLFHGNGGSAADRSGIAQRLTEHGFRVVLVEYPGFGLRPGKATMGTALVASKDAARAARQRWMGPFYIGGESFGAGVAAQVAQANRDHCAGVLLFTPWDSFNGLVDEKFFGLPIHWLLKEKMETASALEATVGTLVVVGAENDELIPVHHARDLAHVLPTSRYMEIAKASHNDWLSYMLESDWQAIEFYLNPSSKITPSSSKK